MFAIQFGLSEPKDRESVAYQLYSILILAHIGHILNLHIPYDTHRIWHAVTERLKSIQSTH